MSDLPARTGKPSQEMASILARLAREDAGMPDPTTLPPAEGRECALLANRRWNRELPPMNRTDSVTFDGPNGQAIAARLFTPDGRDDGLIMYIHGGGFAVCDIETHERFTRLLALSTGCSVLSVNYRLAPEHPYPAGLLDCVGVFRDIDKIRAAFPWTNGPMVISGDSAGANLALSLILHEQARGLPCPNFALLFYGVFGADFNTPSYRKFEYGPGLTRAKMMRYMDWYVPESQRNDPLVAPVNASDAELRALPPIYFNAAEIDPLCSDTESLVARLHNLGRRDTLQIVPGVVHGFLQMSLCLPAACRAIEDAGAAFRNLAGNSSITLSLGASL